MEKRLVRVGKFEDPEDARKPYYAAIAWFANSPIDTAVIQPVSGRGLFLLLARIIDQYGPVTVDAELVER